jgi:uncharacterized protein (TIGR02444 family)
LKKAGDSKIGENPFWEWSLEFYDQPGVAPKLLTLQDEYSCNINLVLWLLWRDGVSAAILSHAQTALAKLSGVYTLPLRQIRQRARAEPLKAKGEKALYQALKQTELLAERMEQDCLYALSASGENDPDAPHDLRDSFAAYLTSLGLVGDKNSQAQEIFAGLLAIPPR